MILDITIQADSDNHTDMTALAALIASLGGRAPTAAAIVAQDTGNTRTVPVADAPNVSGEPAGTAVSEPSEQSASTAAGSPDKDSVGVPWDERIHSESRATIGDGTWRKRRNVPQDVYDSVLAELTGGDVPLPPTATTPDTPEPPAQTAAATAPAAAGATSVGEAAAATSVGEAAAASSVADDVPPPPADADGPDLSSWPKFVQSVQDKPDKPDAAKTYAALNVLSETFGASKFLEMRDKSDKWALFYEMVGE